MAESVLVELTGKPQSGVTSKDIALALLTMPVIPKGACVDRIDDFAGPAITAMSTDERTTLTNMIAEFGGPMPLRPRR